jgi:hypothetical protein
LHIPFLPLSLTDVVNGAGLVLFVASTDESYFVGTRFLLLSFTHFLLLLLEQDSWNFERRLLCGQKKRPKFLHEWLSLLVEKAEQRYCHFLAVNNLFWYRYVS